MSVFNAVSSAMPELPHNILRRMQCFARHFDSNTIVMALYSPLATLCTIRTRIDASSGTRAAGRECLATTTDSLLLVSTCMAHLLTPRGEVLREKCILSCTGKGEEGESDDNLLGVICSPEEK